MTKRFVTQSLICRNCAHCSMVRMNGQTQFCCDFNKMFVLPTDTFCIEFDGLPLLEVEFMTKRLVDTGHTYIVR